VSQELLTPGPWSCPTCGRRVPARITVCHCGTTRDRALALRATAPALPAGPRSAVRRDQDGMPSDVRVLLAAAALVATLGLAWAVLGPAPPNRTTPVLGWVDPGPPDPAALRAKYLKKPPPQPPFKLPWWK
jgi:hypothetical protein